METESENNNHQQCYLTRLGDAPTRADRHKRGLYRCELCGNIKSIIDYKVRAGLQVSCGCLGRKMYGAHMAQRAANIAPGTRALAFKLTHDYRRNTGVYSARSAAQRLHLSTSLIKALIALQCQIIKGLAGLGKKGLAVLKSWEKRWLGWSRRQVRSRYYAGPAKTLLTKHAGLSWQDRLNHALAARNHHNEADAHAMDRLPDGWQEDMNLDVQIGLTPEQELDEMCFTEVQAIYPAMMAINLTNPDNSGNFYWDFWE